MREWQISQLPAGANKTDIEERFDRAGNESGVVIQYIQGFFFYIWYNYLLTFQILKNLYLKTHRKLCTDEYDTDLKCSRYYKEGQLSKYMSMHGCIYSMSITF